jgi:hypothetical protein
VAVTAIANKLQAELLNPAVLADLRAKIREQARQERDPSALNALRARLAELSRQIDQGHSNLAILPPDVVPKVLAKVRGLEAEHGRLSAELERLTRESAGAAAEKLEGVIATAEGLLWRLREAITAGRPSGVRALLGELVDRVVLDFAPGQRRGNRSELVGGSIYLKQDGCPLPASEVVDLLRVPIHPPGRPGVVKHTRTPWSGSPEGLDRFLGDREEGLRGGP